MPQTLNQAEAQKLLNYYLKHPEEFGKDVFGVLPWHMQVEILKSVFDNKYTAVKTCNAVGKSFIAAVIVVTFLMLYPGSIVVTTAPTWRQVTDVLWREIATMIKRSKYKLTDAEVRQAGLSLDTNWYAVGLSTSRPENFFGYHADFILVVVDEAGGVDEPIFKGVAAITPNANAHVLLIGNPTEPTGTFYNAFNTPEMGYKNFTISAFDTPNFTATGITDLETLLEKFTAPKGIDQAEWIRKVNAEIEPLMNPVYTGLIAPSVVFGRYHEWGTDSPSWESLVMGEFPSQAEQALIPVNLVTMAMNMTGIDEDSGMTMAELSGWEIPDGPQEYGLDMARFGNDSTVLIPRRGGWVDSAIAWNKTDLMTSADKVLQLVNPYDPDMRLNIDDTGNGGGTTDRLRQISRQELDAGRPSHRYALSAYNFGSKERMRYPEKFHDITSELYWNLRGWFFRKQIAMPYDKQLFNELVGRRFSLTPNGKIKVESKDEYKKRTGGKSPDRSDALALAFAGRLRHEYNEPTAAERAADKIQQEQHRPLTSGMTRDAY